MGKRSRTQHEPPKTPPIAERPQRGVTSFVIAGLLIVTAVIYLQVRSHDFVYDDEVYVSHNAQVLGGLSMENVKWAFTSIRAAAVWQPLTWISLMTDVQMFGANPGTMALVNVVLHALTAILLFLVLRFATGSDPLSAVVSFLFAVHPMHVEAVAWVSERKDVLSALFFIAAIGAWLRYLRARSIAWYAASLCSFALALMAKGIVITLPFVLLLLDYWPLDRIALRWKLLVEKLPFFAITLAGIYATWVPKQAGGAMARVPLSQRLANVAISYGTYLWKTLWPSSLAPLYPLPDTIDWPRVIVSVIAVLALTAIAIVAARRHRYVLVGWLWFVGMLFPVSGIVQQGTSPMADRFTYLPHIGLFIAIVWWAASNAGTRALVTASALVVVAFTAVSFAQTQHWKDNETLWKHTIAVTEKNSIAHLNLANAYQQQGEWKEELEQLTTAADLDPTSADLLVRLARAEMKAGRGDLAIRHLQQAVRLGSSEEAEALLALLQNDAAGAVSHFAKAIATSDSASLRNDYGAALATLGRDSEALAQYDAALRLDPRQYDARMNSGALLARMEKYDDAAAAFERASALRPASPEPHVYLALVRTSQHGYGDALDHIRKAIAIDHELANTQFTNAVHIPPKPSNVDEYAHFLQTQVQR